MRRYIVSGMSKVVLMARIISYLLRRINMDLLIYAYKVALAAGELDAVEVDEFGFRPCLLRSGLGRLQHFVRIPPLARAGIEEHRKWLVVNHG